MFHNFFFLGVVFSLLTGFATPAFAYIGPAIVVLSSIMGPVAAFVVLVILTLFYPVLKLYRKLKSKSQQTQRENKDDDPKTPWCLSYFYC